MSTPSTKSFQCSRSIHEDDPNYICNPASGRYILRDGRIGRQLVRAQNPEKYTRRCKYGQKNGRVCNKVTGKWVKPTSYVGTEISKNVNVLKKGKRKCMGDKSAAKSKGKTVCNPETGYWVKPQKKKTTKKNASKK